MDDLWDAFSTVLASRPVSSPWARTDERMFFQPDLAALAALVSIPIRAGAESQTGRLAKAVDAWTSHELRRAGFDADEVWPRMTRPRVLPRDLALYLRGLPARERAAAEARLLANKAVAPSDARVLGRAYVKQVDVLIAQWSRGPELIVSTKTMVSSFRNNLANRFEESYGDAKNLRGRHPLVSMGFLMFLRSTATAEPGTLDRVTDMLRKLQEERDVYDASCLIVAEWSDEGADDVTIREDLVPPDLGAGRFLARLVDRVLSHTPIDMHVAVREAREQRNIAVTESNEAGEP